MKLEIQLEIRHLKPKSSSHFKPSQMHMATISICYFSQSSFAVNITNASRRAAREMKHTAMTMATNTLCGRFAVVAWSFSFTAVSSSCSSGLSYNEVAVSSPKAIAGFMKDSLAVAFISNHLPLE